MSLARLYLLACGIFSVVAGLGYVVRPVEMAALAELELESSTAIIEIQGFYGGQMVGMGLAMLLGVVERRFLLPALVLTTASLGGTAAGRLCGIVMEGSLPTAIAVLLVLEAATAIVGAMLIRGELARAD